MSEQLDRADLLGVEPIGKLLWKFSVPAIIGMVVNALYNIVDRIFLGQISNDAIAAVYVTFPVVLIMMAMDMLFGIGGTALTSIRLGQKRRAEAEHILSNVAFMLFAVSLVTGSLMYLFLDPMLKAFGASDQLLPMARAYQTIMIIGLPWQMMGFGLNSFIRGEGNPLAAMMSMLIGAISNIILDYIFIIRFGWGVEGAALATIIGQGFSWIWVMSYFLRKNSPAILKIRRHLLFPRWSILKDVMALGMPFFGMQVATAGVMVVFNHELYYWGGDLAVATMGIFQSVITICLFPIFGINQGVQPILGYNYGAELYARVKKALRMAIAAGTVFLVIITALIYIFPDQILHIFVSNPVEYEKIYDMAHLGFRIFYSSVPILAYPIIGAIYFQATGRAKLATFLSMARQLFILVPVLLILAHFFGLFGIWIAYPVSDVLSTIITAYFLERELRKLPNEDHATPAIST